MPGEERNHPFFEPDEYTAINTRYFAEMRQAGLVQLDPSGWIETLTEVPTLPQPSLHRQALGRYYMDEGSALGTGRLDLHRLLGTWEGLSFDPERFTACPSVGIASLLTLAVLRRMGASRIIFETPCYFAAILQAEWLGYETVLMPTYRREAYRRPPDYEAPFPKTSSIWWLTHPRVTLGFDQEPGPLRNLIEAVGSQGYVVLDEALDQSFPSQFGAMHHTWPAARRLIRLKSFGKPLGLNGYRLAFVLHPAELREDMVDCLETFGGAIDAYSLAAACAVSKEPQHFRMMMRAANTQVLTLRAAAEKIAMGSTVFVNPLRNGYLGSAVINLQALGVDQPTRRHRFLQGCQRRNMPVIIGPSMHFASDPPTEAVRLNFFSKREDILRGIALLAEIGSGLI